MTAGRCILSTGCVTCWQGQLCHHQLWHSSDQAVFLHVTKPSGGVRGIVAGDVVRRLVAKTIAQQLTKVVEKATAPFQYALSTQAGCECVSHVLQGLTEINPRATITSIDGVSAYDLLSRGAMLEGLRRVEGGDQVVPFVRMFHGSPSEYLWEDATGVVHRIPQGEGGEQGDPLMPLLFAVGQHGALAATQESLQAGERLVAFLDDIYTVTLPERVGPVNVTLQAELWRHAKITVHGGKTKVWNSAGERPEACHELERVARLSDPEAIVWRGSGIPVDRQGIKVLGAPIGHPEFVRRAIGDCVPGTPDVAQQNPACARHSVRVVAGYSVPVREQIIC